MSKKKRRRFSPDQKVAILKKHPVGREPVSGICDEFKIHPTQFYQWQKMFFELGHREQKTEVITEKPEAKKIRKQGPKKKGPITLTSKDLASGNYGPTEGPAGRDLTYLITGSPDDYQFTDALSRAFETIEFHLDNMEERMTDDEINKAISDLEQAERDIQEGRDKLRNQQEILRAGMKANPSQDQRK